MNDSLLVSLMVNGLQSDRFEVGVREETKKVILVSTKVKAKNIP